MTAMTKKQYRQCGALLLALALAGCSAESAGLADAAGGGPYDGVGTSYVRLSLAMAQVCND